MPTRMYVTCPSYAFQNPVDRASILKRARIWADALGWQVTYSPLLEQYHPAGTWLPLAEREADMAHALEYDVVWACRGGYGAVHLVPFLLNAQTSNRPMLIGYSDTTVLHACWRVRGWGPAAYGTFGESVEDSRQGISMAALLCSEVFQCSQETEPAVRVLRPGHVRAPMFTACLVVLANLAGTPAFPDLRGHILAIEDINERPYAIDFALQQLYLAGKLDGIVGLVCGAFHHQTDSDYGGLTVDEVLAGWAERLNIPTLSRLPFGHLEDQLVLPCGIDVELNASSDGTWSLTWPG